MAFARHYVMVAQADQAQALSKALLSFSDVVDRLPGCEGIDIFQDLDVEHRFIFAERWLNQAAHEGGASLIPKAALNAVMALLAEPPKACNLCYVEADDLACDGQR